MNATRFRVGVIESHDKETDLWTIESVGNSFLVPRVNFRSEPAIGRIVRLVYREIGNVGRWIIEEF